MKQRNLGLKPNKEDEFELRKLEMEHDLRIREVQSKMVVVKEECPGVIVAIRLP